MQLLDQFSLQINRYLTSALGIWIFVYLYLRLKFYFERGYFLTSNIFITTSISYSITLSMGIAVFAVLYECPIVDLE